MLYPTIITAISDSSMSITDDIKTSRIFVVGAELAVQSQQRRWDDGTRHPQLQPALSSARTDERVLSWRLDEDSVSSGHPNAVTTL